MNVCLIGSGNVATVLGKKISAAGHHITRVISRNREHARSLAGILGTGFDDQISAVDKTAQICLLAISDTALAAVSHSITEKRMLILHTSGAVPISVLEGSSNYGVLYPLQSLNKNLKTIPDIPFLIDGNTSDDRSLIMDFARTLSNQVRVAGDEERLRLHLAAVFVNNFGNYLFTLVKEYCKNEKLPFDWLFPIIQETASRLQLGDPSALQTGPARRNDLATLKKHEEQLKSYPDMLLVYQVMSAGIQKYYEGLEQPDGKI